MDAHGDPLPFATPPEARLLGHWTQPGPHLRPQPDPDPSTSVPSRAAPGTRLPDRPGEPEPQHTREPEPEGVCAVAAGPAGDGDA